MKSLSLFYLLILIGDKVLITIQVRRRRYFIVLGFTVVSRCILGNGRRENLEHRRRGDESVLRKACDTRASTSSSSLSSHRFLFALSILFLQCYCNFIHV